MQNKKRWIIWSSLIAILAIGAWYGYSWYLQKRMEVEQSLVRPIPVMAAPVEQHDVPVLIEAFGDLRAHDIAQLSAQAAGNIIEIDFAGGEKVAKDTQLIVVENATQKANLQKAQAQQTLDQLDFERTERLTKSGALPLQNLDQARAKLEASKADVLSAQDALDKTYTKAPFAGRLSARLVSIGEYVPVGQDLVQIVNLDTLKVQYSVPQQYLSKLEVGQEAEISISAYPDRKFTGTVDYIAPAVDPITRSIGVEALVNNQEDLLSPGLSTQVTQVLGHDLNALIVPEESLVYALEGPSVFLAEEDPTFELDPRVKEQILIQQSAQLNIPVDQLPPLQIKKVNRVSVETGTFQNGKVQITKGVKAGDVVITQGQQKLRDGAIVMIVDPNKRLAAAAAAEKAAEAKQ
jgi:membrane fusion protein (multidrug efflux system)